MTRPSLFKWWMREGRICEEDGHPDAAAAAYNQAAQHAPDDFKRGLAESLRDGIMERK